MGAEQWFVLEDGDAKGPLSARDLLKRYFSGQYDQETLVWHSDTPQDRWTPIGEALPLNALTPPPLPAAKASPPESVVNEASPSVGWRQPESDVWASYSAPAAPHSDLPAGWQSERPYAWRRYFARSIDNFVGGGLMYQLFLGIIGAVDDALYQAFINIGTDPAGRFLNTIIIVMLAIIPNAVLIGFTGRTLGKLLTGVRVRDRDGAPIGFIKALRREFGVLAYGLGFAIPFVNLITAVTSYSRLKDTSRTKWDEDLECVTEYRPTNAKHWILMILGVGGYVILSLILLAAANERV